MKPSSKNKDHILIGITAGLILPALSYGILTLIYELLDSVGLASGLNLSSQFRQRTIALIAICTNLILVNYFNRRYLLNSMRGVVFPTLAFVVVWVIYFKAFSF